MVWSGSCLLLAAGPLFLFLFILTTFYVVYPAAPSSTATLLRLHPSYRSFHHLLTKISREINSRGVTGGVYKAREHIHRRMSDRRLLAIPTSRKRVAVYDPN